MSVLPKYKSIPHVWCHRGQKRPSDSLGLEVETAFKTHHVCSGNWTRVLCKDSNYYYYFLFFSFSFFFCWAISLAPGLTVYFKEKLFFFVMSCKIDYLSYFLIFVLYVVGSIKWDRMKYLYMLYKMPEPWKQYAKWNISETKLYRHTICYDCILYWSDLKIGQPTETKE